MTLDPETVNERVDKFTIEIKNWIKSNTTILQNLINTNNDNLSN